MRRRRKRKRKVQRREREFQKRKRKEKLVSVSLFLFPLSFQEQAAAKLRKALEIEKNETWATRDNLGLVLFNHGAELARQKCQDHSLIIQKFEEAFAEFEKASSDAKSDGSPGINLGLALYTQVATCESFLPPTEVAAILERCYSIFRKTIDDPRMRMKERKRERKKLLLQTRIEEIFFSSSRVGKA